MENSKEDLFEFDWRNLTKLLLKELGISEGLWQPGCRLQFGAAMMGITDSELLPSGAVSVKSLMVRRVSDPGPLVFDAAELMTDGEKVTTVAKKPAKKRLSATKTATKIG